MKESRSRAESINSSFDDRKEKRNITLSDTSEKDSIKSQVFHELSKNPLLTAKQLCQLLHYSYKQYGAYFRNLCSEWKRNQRNEHASKRLNFHNWKGWAYAPLSVDRSAALGKDWVQSRAKNRYFVYKDRLGRLTWFETGRVNIWVRKHANDGKLAQLVANGFFRTGLINDPRVLQAFIVSVRLKGGHITEDLGERLPYSRNDLLKDSLGVVVKTGDISHPMCVEIDFCLPKWMEEAVEDRRAFVEVVKRLFDSSDSRHEKNDGKNIGVV